MVEILLDGRTDVDDYFKRSGVLDSETLNHTPLLAFIIAGDTVKVSIVHRPAELLSLRDETPVMGQWRGEWRSDFFQFNVGQLRKRFEAKCEPLKTARNVVKAVGPRGGFRSLSYEYTDESGATVHAGTGFRREAQRLESFFAQHNIPIEVRQSTKGP